MEYTDNCPNCGQQVMVEEDESPHAHVIKNMKGDVIMSCPKCHKRLEIIDGAMSIKNDTV